MNLERREFLKIISLGSVAALGFTFFGCGNGETNEVDGEKTMTKEEKEFQETFNQVKTGNTVIKEAGTHMIYLFNKYRYHDHDVLYLNGELKLPDGYAYVSSEAITDIYGDGSATYGIKYNLINVVDVTAEEWQDKETGEISYPFAGTPLDLEEAKDKPKVLSMTK